LRRTGSSGSDDDGGKQSLKHSHSTEVKRRFSGKGHSSQSARQPLRREENPRSHGQTSTSRDRHAGGDHGREITKQSNRRSSSSSEERPPHGSERPRQRYHVDFVSGPDDDGHRSGAKAPSSKGRTSGRAHDGRREQQARSHSQIARPSGRSRAGSGDLHLATRHVHVDVDAFPTKVGVLDVRPPRQGGLSLALAMDVKCYDERETCLVPREEEEEEEEPPPYPGSSAGSARVGLRGSNAMNGERPVAVRERSTPPPQDHQSWSSDPSISKDSGGDSRPSAKKGANTSVSSPALREEQPLPRSRARASGGDGRDSGNDMSDHRKQPPKKETLMASPDGSRASGIKLRRDGGGLLGSSDSSDPPHKPLPKRETIATSPGGSHGSDIKPRREDRGSSHGSDGSGLPRKPLAKKETLPSSPGAIVHASSWSSSDDPGGPMVYFASDDAIPAKPLARESSKRPVASRQTADRGALPLESGVRLPLAKGAEDAQRRRSRPPP
jgi:hypothetical protein